MRTDKNRGRMWLFIVVCTLGLNIFPATGEGNTTQMYYIKLTIEKSAIANLTALLKSDNVINDNPRVDRLNITTECHNVLEGTECKCTNGHKWSDKVCKDCETFKFPQNSTPAMCVSDNEVTVSGSFTLKDGYTGCLQNNKSVHFKNCNDELNKKMKEVFSTLEGFENLILTGYKIGSVIAEFEMKIAYTVNPKDLIKVSETLSKNLSASFHLETSGLVRMEIPPQPVRYNSQLNIACVVTQNLDAVPIWNLGRSGKTFPITNGTESTVTDHVYKSNVGLKNVSELWAGNYTCAYDETIDSSSTISHRGRGELDVCLLPIIKISMNPSFLLCKDKGNILKIIVQCVIPESSESYNVNGTDTETVSFSRANGRDTYQYDVIFSCSEKTPIDQLHCTFENRCNETRRASLSVPEYIINGDDKYCGAVDDWQITKVGFTAVLECDNLNLTGNRKRKCENVSGKAVWRPEVSECVDLKVYNVLQEANIVDIGLGSLNDNSARVFSLLQNVTRNTQTINTFPNMKGSVEVLTVLSQKNVQPDGTATNDFLESSSNLLDQSLNDTWISRRDQGNRSLAANYLTSVESLIKMSNISGVPKKRNVEVLGKSCSAGSLCSSRVFNITVELDTEDSGNVKTAAFKELQNYFPKDDDNFRPNSLIVSATMEHKSKPLKVRITFELQDPRPRNVKMKCVYWDNETSNWSTQGCEWKGPSEEELCVCNHLSSFALMISGSAETIPGSKEMTAVGLSVSVAALVISLAIELLVWSSVVKTNTLYLRHIAHVNISLCLLVGNCCFLASSDPERLSEIWCQTLAMLKHFFYLAMFFWMLCLSSTLLHQTLFLFHTVSKKNYLIYSLVIGYVCPLLIVTITVLANKGGAEHVYFSKDSCWLVYSGKLKGSIYAFVLPFGIIVIFNVFSMLVVIIKLLDHPKDANASCGKEKRALITAIRSVVLLTPVFGVTWGVGLISLAVDLTSGSFAYVIQYAFILLNSFQGLFIFLTTCVGDKMTRDALLNRLRRRAPASSTKDSSTTDSTWK